MNYLRWGDWGLQMGGVVVRNRGRKRLIYVPKMVQLSEYTLLLRNSK